jgi:hypothetical protein
MYASVAQERFANANPEKFGGKAVVEEFNQASKGKKLPKRKQPKQEEPKKETPVTRMRHTAR